MTFDGELYSTRCWSNQLSVVSVRITVELIAVNNVV